MSAFSFTITGRDNQTAARTGIIHTPHGDILTPAFVPVGTQATVKAVPVADLMQTGTQLFFVNSYHMYLRPGADIVKKAGGLHGFMGWDRPLITDSGGFQIFSLGAKKFSPKETTAETLVRIDDDQVTFQSHWDGSSHVFTPESAMNLQWDLGSDIHIAFDDCTPYPVSQEQAEKSLKRTHRWATASVEAHQKRKHDELASGGRYQALYGSVQGSVYQHLRMQSAKFIGSLPVDGIAIGGVSVGESKEEMQQVMQWVTPYLPDALPRHLLGIGEIDDIFALVSAGIDTFDCVDPTRLARMGECYVTQKQPTGSGLAKSYRLVVSDKAYQDAFIPIDATCPCVCCKTVTRAYIHHLFRTRELLAYYLVSVHNITFMHRLTEAIRNSIQNGTFVHLREQWLSV